MPENEGLFLQIEIMPLGLDRHTVDDRALDDVEIARIGAQDMLEIYRVFLAQTQQQTSFDGQSHAVAIVAEVVTVR